MKRLRFIILFLIPLLLCSCASRELKRQNETLRKAVYVTKDAIDKGRYDVAKRTINEVIRVTAPPKNKVVVNKFVDKDEKQYIVLPSEQYKIPVITLNDESYKLILSNNPKLQEELKKEEIEIKKIEVEVDKTLQNNQEKLEKADEIIKKDISKKWWKGAFWGFSILGILGIVALLIFVPSLIPVFIQIVQTIFSLIGQAISAILKLFNRSG